MGKKEGLSPAGPKDEGDSAEALRHGALSRGVLFSENRGKDGFLTVFLNLNNLIKSKYILKIWQSFLRIEQEFDILFTVLKKA